MESNRAPTLRGGKSNGLPMTAQQRSKFIGLSKNAGLPKSVGLLALLALGGCSFAEEALWPSITNSRPITESQDQQVVVGQLATTVAVVSAPEETNYLAPERTALDDDLPAAGPQEQLWDDSLTAAQTSLNDRNSRLKNMRATSRDALQNFQARSESINKRLLASTSPDDEVLRTDWGRCRGDLDVVEEVTGQYQALSEENLAAAAALTDLQAEIRGADPTLGPRLAALAGDTAKTLAVVQDLSSALTQDSNALAARANLASLDLDAMEAAIPGGAYVGDALARRAQGVAPAPPAEGGAQLVGQAEPLAVINFADESNAFEPALFSIVYAALARHPNAGFDLVGVSPRGLDESEFNGLDLDGRGIDGTGLDESGPIYTSRQDLGRANAQRVRRALLSMGLPADRMTLDIASSPAAGNEEVHIYVR